MNAEKLWKMYKGLVKRSPIEGISQRIMIKKPNCKYRYNTSFGSIIPCYECEKDKLKLAYCDDEKHNICKNNVRRIL